jgi:hypothetical protein
VKLKWEVIAVQSELPTEESMRPSGLLTTTKITFLAVGLPWTPLSVTQVKVRFKERPMAEVHDRTMFTILALVLALAVENALLVGKVSVPMRTSLKEVKIWKKKTATCI